MHGLQEMVLRMQGASLIAFQTSLVWALMRSFYCSGREISVRYNQKNKIVQTGADWNGILWDKWHYKGLFLEFRVQI
jgi:hypothetical protein